MTIIRELISMKECFSFGTYYQSIYFMSTVLLKDNINGVCVPQFKFSYIRNKAHILPINLFKLCCDMHYMWWGKRYLEPQKWEDCIKYKKIIILDIIMLVPNKNTIRYKEHETYFIAFDFRDVITIIYWPENMKFYVYDIVESYKESIIFHLGNPAIVDLLLHILQCC